MTKTPIEWTRGEDGTEGKSWNPLRGCSLKSRECERCYAQGIAYRFSGPGQAFEGLINRHGKWNGVMRQAPEATLYEPLTWRKPTRVFVNSMTDLFHENAPFEWVDRIFAIMALCPRHTFIVLTKRDDLMREYVTTERGYTVRGCAWEMLGRLPKYNHGGLHERPWPLPNVILGVSVGMREFVPRIDNLRETPAAVRMVSFEPLLEDVGTVDLRGIHWSVVGGESGHGAAAMHPDWARSLRDQSVAAGAAFHFKQWGMFIPADQEESRHFCYEDERAEHVWDSNSPSGYSIRVGKKAAGRVLDGRTWDEFPQLQVR